MGIKKTQSTIRLGLLGGGQLARMLALKCHDMSIQPYVLSPSVQDPAAQVTSFFVKGSLYSKKDLTSFLKQVDVATFENEFLDMSLLSKLSKDTKTPVYPSPRTMNLLQDRFKQKNLFKKYNIPTAKFISLPIDSHKTPQQRFNQLMKLFPNGFVLKKRHQAYDGYGTCIVTSIKDKTKAVNFIKKSQDLIVEEFIPFKKEMATILVRNRKKQIIELPLVHTYQEQARCVWLKGPCQHKNKSILIKKLKTMLKQINYVGVIAFELFDTSKGLLVNELAPRVHNSGHYSLDALSEDQFTLHIKAVLNQDLFSPVLQTKGFAMLNLLAGKQLNPQIKMAETKKEVKLYWYGKQEHRPGRKMGHLNALASTPEKALKKLKNDK